MQKKASGVPNVSCKWIHDFLGKFSSSSLLQHDREDSSPMGEGAEKHKDVPHGMVVAT